MLQPKEPASKRQRAIRAAHEALSNRELGKVEPALRDLLNAKKPDAEALYLMGVAFEMAHRPGDAARYARKALDLFEHEDAVLLLARTKRAMGETDEAVELCDRVIRKNPFHRVANLIKGGALEEAGRFDEARGVIGPMLERAHKQGVPAQPAERYEWAKLLVQGKQFAEGIALIDELLEETDANDLKRNALHLRAKACDRMKDYDGAFESGLRANEFGKLDFDPELYEEQVSVLIENWSREKMERFPVSSVDSEVPVFVAGMPRSGTSLIDQIIDAHPKAAGVGELGTIQQFALQVASAWDPEKEPPASFGKFDSFRWTRAAKAYLKDIQSQAPTAERIVNKALGNNRLVGMIARLFPKTRIIHAIRDPRDVAISCFMGGFNNRLHAWTTQIDWVARAWEQSMRMMEHWKSALDVPILDVHYERLVTDPEREFPRIIEFLGLEWDDACREFHKSRRTVRTLSYDQVNRPIYATSAGRHANYAAQIEGIEFPVYDPAG
ncbi:MAG: tetratricopeptide repeat-containing sulfotransferase family protein [Phycisphaerales bacterium JB037]